jgi:hypothetical protein
MTGQRPPRSNEWFELRELEEVGSILSPLALGYQGWISQAGGAK